MRLHLTRYVALLALCVVPAALVASLPWPLATEEADAEAARGNVDRAFRLLRRTLEDRPGAPAYLWLRAARLARRAEDLREAERLLAEAERHGASPAGVAFERLLLRAQRGRAVEASRALAPRLAAGGLEAELSLEALGRGYLRVYRLREARDSFETLLVIRPQSVPGLLGLAEVKRQWPYQPWGYNPAAAGIPELRKAVSLAPWQAGARLGLAERLVLGGAAASEPDLREAEAHLRAVLAQRPGDLYVRTLLGTLLLDLLPRRLAGLAELEAAGRALLEGVLVERPNHVPALRALAELHHRNGNDTAALKVSQRVLGSDPKDSESLQVALRALRGLRWKQRKVASEWRQLGREMSALEARLWEAQCAEVELNELKNRMTGGLVSNDPNDPAWRLQAGLIALKLGRPKEARLWFERALIERPSYGPAKRALEEHFGGVRGTGPDN